MFLYIRMRYFASQHFAYARVMILPSWVTSLLTALSRWCVGRESTCQCRSCRGHEFDSWVGKIPGEGNGNPLQYSCLRNPIDRGAWWAAVHGVTKVQTWLSNWAHISTCFCSKITWLENNLYSQYISYVCVCVLVTQLCLTLWDSMDCSPLGSPCPWDSPGKNTGVGCPTFSRASFQLRDWTWVSRNAGRFFTIWATREAPV